MAQSPTFKCQVCSGFHGGMRKATCPPCAKKWQEQITELEKQVRGLATDVSDLPGHFRKTSEEIQKRLAKMKGMFGHG